MTCLFILVLLGNGHCQKTGKFELVCQCRWSQFWVYIIRILVFCNTDRVNMFYLSLSSIMELMFHSFLVFCLCIFLYLFCVVFTVKWAHDCQEIRQELQSLMLEDARLCSMFTMDTLCRELASIIHVSSLPPVCGI